MEPSSKQDAVVELEGVEAQARAGELSWVAAREYFETRKLLLAFVLVLTLGSPFLGLIFAGWPGVFIGLVVSVATFLLGLRAITNVRSVERGN